MNRSCAEWQTDFELALDGERPQATDPALAEHLRTCAVCQEAMCEAVQVHRQLIETGLTGGLAVQDPAEGSRTRPSSFGVNRTSSRRRFSRSVLLAGAAALLAAVGAVWLFPRQTPATVSAAYILESGGMPLARGDAVSAAEKPVLVTLGSYCRLQLHAGSALRIEGQEKAEQVLLERGRVTCEVNRNIGTFSLRSEAGTATVKGTQFDARLEEPERSGGQGIRKLSVTVSAGTVLLSGSSGERILSAGDTWSVSNRPRPSQPGDATPALLEELTAYRPRIVYETIRDGNWDLYLVEADGSNPVNLTRTPDVDELYPKASPDGTRIAFVADEGKGDAKSRNLYVMNVDGTERRKIADNAREPCWNADGTRLAYLKGESVTFDPMDFMTTGLFIYDTRTGTHSQHPNTDIRHLYCVSWSPDGNWFVTTIHGGLGIKHAIVALNAHNKELVNFGLQGVVGCRPDLSPDGRKLAWGLCDHGVRVADVDLGATPPRVSGIRNVVEFPTSQNAFHAAWSPDHRYVAFTYGPNLEGSGRALQGSPELPGNPAAGWNICVADAAGTNRWVAVTFDGASCKEPDWVPVRKGAQK